MPEWLLDSLDYPDYIKYWRASNMLDPTTTTRLLKFCRQYDVIHAHPPGPVYCPFIKRPYLTWDSGSVRSWALNLLPDGSPKWAKNRLQHLAADRAIVRRAHKHAYKIVANDPDTITNYFNKLPWLPKHKIIHLPHPIDTEFWQNGYEPSIWIPQDETFTVFAPARHEWNYKANQKIIKGFALFVRANPDIDTVLYLVNWGTHARLSALLVRDLKIEHKVTWLQVMPKPQLREAYHASSIVIGQLETGAYGLVTPEAWASRKPVITYINDAYYKEHFKESPPAINMNTPHQLANALSHCYYTPNYPYYMALLGHKYVEEHHNHVKIAKRLIPYYEEALH